MLKTLINILLLTFLIFPQSCSANEWVNHWANSIVAIGDVKEVEDKGKAFIPRGTGIIIKASNDPSVPLFIVSAAHNFPFIETKNIIVRFDWFSNYHPTEHLGTEINLIKNQKSLLIHHNKEGVDLACFPLLISPEQVKIKKFPYISVNAFFDSMGAIDARDVFIIGYPSVENYIGLQFSSRPTLRKGIVSWTSPFKAGYYPILIDGTIVTGDSGGPVIISPSNNFSKDTALLGLAIRRFVSKKIEIINDSRLFAKVTDDMTVKVTNENVLFRHPINLVEVVPANNVKELLEYAIEFYKKEFKSNLEVGK